MSLTATRASAAGTRFYRCAPVIAGAALLAACGSGGGGGGISSSPAPPPPTPAPPPFVFPAPEAQFRVSGPSGFAAGCDNEPATGTLFADAEVEPHISVNPANAMNLIGVWQQNRFSNGAAQGLIGAYSNDGGATWTRTTAPLSRCTGGNAGNGGDYARATDPWVTFAPDGTAYWMSLSITGASFSAGSANAMLVARSIDGGQTWSNPTTLIREARRSSMTRTRSRQIRPTRISATRYGIG